MKTFKNYTFQRHNHFSSFFLKWWHSTQPLRVALVSKPNCGRDQWENMWCSLRSAIAWVILRGFVMCHYHVVRWLCLCVPFLSITAPFQNWSLQKPKSHMTPPSKLLGCKWPNPMMNISWFDVTDLCVCINKSGAASCPSSGQGLPHLNKWINLIIK